MSGVKTAISLDEALFKEVDTMAHQMHISRSRLFVLAIEDFIKRRESQALLDKLNAAYADLQEEEREVSRQMKAKRPDTAGRESW